MTPLPPAQIVIMRRTANEFAFCCGPIPELRARRCPPQQPRRQQQCPVRLHLSCRGPPTKLISCLHEELSIARVLVKQPSIECR